MTPVPSKPLIQFVRVGEHELPLPARASEGDFGYDVAALKRVRLRKGPQLVGIGFKLAAPLPEGVAMMVIPRSSTRRKFNATIPNSPGLVDRYYGGEIMVQVEAVDPDEYAVIEAGDRFAQLIFVPLLTPDVVEVAGQAETMTRAGFGSTGS